MMQACAFVAPHARRDAPRSWLGQEKRFHADTAAVLTGEGGFDRSCGPFRVASLNHAENAIIETNLKLLSCNHTALHLYVHVHASPLPAQDLCRMRRSAKIILSVP